MKVILVLEESVVLPRIETEAHDRQPVFGIFERNGRVYTEIIPDCSLRTLRKIIQGTIDLSSTIYSDSWRGYAGLVDVGYDKYFRISHRKDEFSRGHVHVNGIESFW